MPEPARAGAVEATDGIAVTGGKCPDEDVAADAARADRLKRLGAL